MLQNDEIQTGRSFKADYQSLLDWFPLLSLLLFCKKFRPPWTFDFEILWLAIRKVDHRLDLVRTGSHLRLPLEYKFFHPCPLKTKYIKNAATKGKLYSLYSLLKRHYYSPSSLLSEDGHTVMNNRRRQKTIISNLHAHLRTQLKVSI